MVGQIIDLEFVRTSAEDEAFAGQALFRQWPGRGPLIPEQDLDFLV